MSDGCAECCCCCVLCFACCSLFERVCFWVPIPEKFRSQKRNSIDDDVYFPQQTKREAELFHSRVHATTQEPTPITPMYDPRQPPAGLTPIHQSAPPPAMDQNHGNASRRAFLDEMHEDRRPTHRNSPSAGQSYPPDIPLQPYPPSQGDPVSTQPPASSPHQSRFHNDTPASRDT